jgi:diaminohydroxyphosphoribosylaminopyrimidine deaminase/5-amino-6-(5-phosphoribosylamino)uracil reductase
MADPFPQVAGGGVAALKAAGIDVTVGLLEGDARAINAPYLKLLETGKPWVIAKWAMTLDGKLATRTGDSKWISGEASRQIVHQLRGRMDAIIVGRGTAEADDPLLTARPPGARVATRVVVDSRASLSSESQLVRTAREVPTLVAVSQRSEQANRDRLASAGCELFVTTGESPGAELESLLLELGRRRFTNVLVEGGAILLGALFDQRQVNEVHVFIAPKIVGGVGAISAVGGTGVGEMASALELVEMQSTVVERDLYIRGKISLHNTAGKPRR